MWQHVGQLFDAGKHFLMLEENMKERVIESKNCKCFISYFCIYLRERKVVISDLALGPK